MPADRPPILRDAGEQDAAAIAEIYNQSIAVGDATMDGAEKSARDIKSWLANFSKRETILVFEQPVLSHSEKDGSKGGSVVGWGIIKRYSDRFGYRFCCETAVYLRRDQVGRGLGTRMKKALIERCKEYGYHHLVAKIFADNEASIAYNLRLGYEKVGTQREIGWKNGSWKDVVILQLILDDVAPEIPKKFID